MKILWWSNSPWALTGYGKPTKEIITRLQNAGHVMAAASNFGLYGASLNWEGMPIYPAVRHPLGYDVIGNHAKHFGADLIISLYDIWVLPPDMALRLPCPWVAITPIDGLPISSNILERIVTVDYPMTFSLFGHTELAKAGVWNEYIPLGVDSDIFKPGNKSEARDRLGIPQDTYLMTMIAANKGYPPRKSWPEVLAAFAEFHKNNADALLYIHSTDQPIGPGGELSVLINELNIRDAVTFADEEELCVGVPDEQLAAIYQASDVLLSPSRGEGFGIPLIEAQACGCPVLTQDCTSMSELTVNGVSIEPLQRQWIPQLNYWWQIASVDRILEAMNTIRSQSDTEHSKLLKDAGVNFVHQNYDWDLIVNDYWLPFLSRVETDLEYSTTHPHLWATVGQFHNGTFSIPCVDDKCTAAQQLLGNGKSHTLYGRFNLNVYDQTLSIKDVIGRGSVAKIVIYEIEQAYRLRFIDLGPGDIVVDIGAHIGIVSIYLASAFPGIKIYAYEPMPDLYELLVENIVINEMGGVIIPINKAVTADGRPVSLYGRFEDNSGGMSILNDDGAAEYVSDIPSVTLAGILDHVGHCQLLKLDCEGAEYEILADCSALDNVTWLIGEFHDQGAQGLIKKCQRYIAPDKLRISLGRRK